MNKVSRRSLANWAANQLIEGKSASSIAKYLAAALKESNLESQSNFLINDILWELENRRSLVVCKIISARPLSQESEKALATQIKKATKAHSVMIDNQLDDSILGGVRVETSNHIWDSTISRKLTELKEAK